MRPILDQMSEASRNAVWQETEVVMRQFEQIDGVIVPTERLVAVPAAFSSRSGDPLRCKWGRLQFASSGLFLNTMFREFMCGVTPAPLVTLWKPLAPLRRGFSYPLRG